ncbi:MAG: hypothetical protein ACE5JH_01950 [Acidobacteriota bacterium]
MRSDPDPDIDPPIVSAARWLKVLLILLLIPGLLLFVGGALMRQEQRIWQIYLVNLLFWSGFSQAGVVVSALLNVTNGRWGRNLRHIIAGLALFSPVAFVLFLLLFIGRESIFPWIESPVPEKSAWLDITHLFVRETFNLLLLNILNGVFLYFSFRPDAGLVVARRGAGSHFLLRRISSGWRGRDEERRHCEIALTRLSPVLLLAYAIVYSLVAFDFVMSLDPLWYSTLFGAYYFITNLYMGLAGIAVVAIVLRRAFGLEAHITGSHCHDLGTLIFAFCMIALDFFWSQYLVIWYGNIPEEIAFLVRRINEDRWRPFTLAVLGACFVLPLLILLSRRVKRTPRLLLPVACLVFGSVWLERYVLVVPTIWHGESAPFALPELVVSVAFLSGFVLVYLAFLERFPILPSDARRA